MVPRRRRQVLVMFPLWLAWLRPSKESSISEVILRRKGSPEMGSPDQQLLEKTEAEVS